MKQTALVFWLCLIALTASATVWHVNNNPSMTADFVSLTEAFSSVDVVAGDTLYVYGSPVSYGSLPTLTKRLTLIGPGYYLAQNAGLQHNLSPASVDYLNFGVGSEGSLISGFMLSASDVYAANVVIQRNQIRRLHIFAANCMVLQNFFSDIAYYGYAIYADSASNLVVGNNHIKFSPAGWCIYMTDICSGTFYNNLTWGSCRYRNAEVFNCVIDWDNPGWEWTWDTVNTNVHHSLMMNIYSWDWNEWPLGASNQLNVTAQVFVETGSTDGYYQLCAGSPAIGAGVAGADCGMFGGATPYKLSGIPAIPTIYNFTAPATGFTIPVQIGARSNN